MISLSRFAGTNPVWTVICDLLNCGHQWVIVFFVLSGYLVGGSVLRSVQRNRWSWGEYLFNRLTRLYVVLLPALVVGGLLDFAGSHMLRGGPIYIAPNGEHALYKDGICTLTGFNFLINALFLQNIPLPGFGGDVVERYGSNGALWSLSNEFWYYIAFPLATLAWTGTKLSRKRLALWLALAIVGWFLGIRMVLMGFPLLAGALIHFLPSIRARGARTRLLFCIFSMLLLLGGLLLGRAWNSSIASDLCLGFIIATSVWMLVNCATSPLPRACIWLARSSSRSSYTLYLVHVPILIFLKALIAPSNAHSQLQRLLIGLAMLVLTVIYSQLMFQLFEKRTDSIRETLRNRGILKMADKFSLKSHSIDR